MRTNIIDTHMYIHYCIYNKYENIEFEWDTVKNRTNQQKHHVSFELACRVFQDNARMEFFDTSASLLDEDRWKVIGKAEGKILLVIYTERANGIIRIISARCASQQEKRSYYGNRETLK